MAKCNEMIVFFIQASSGSEGNNICLSEQLDEMPKKRPKKKKENINKCTEEP